MKTTRRDALAHGGRIIATAAVVAFPPSSNPALADAKLLGIVTKIEAEETSIKAKLKKANGKAHAEVLAVEDETDKQMFVIGEMEERLADTSAHTLPGILSKLRRVRYSVAELHSTNDTDEVMISGAVRDMERLVGGAQGGEPDKTVSLEAEYRKANAEWNALPKENRSEHVEVVGKRVTAAIEAFAFAPANSLIGVALKMKLLIEGMKNQHSFEPELAQTALEGVERLAGRRI